MNDIITRQASPLSHIRDRSAEIETLSKLMRFQGHDVTEITRPLTEGERVMLQATIGSVPELLTPADPKQAAATIARMLRAFSRGGSLEDAAFQVDTFLKVVRGLPLWALQAAALDFASGAVGDHDRRFAPNTAQYRHHVMSLVNPVRTTEYMAKKLLAAKPISTGPKKAFDWRAMVASAVDKTKADSVNPINAVE